MSCFYKDFCPFCNKCNGQLDDFCNNDYSSCARYVAGCCLGIDNIPDDLEPLEHVKVGVLIKNKL